ncbi:MAG TPA: hypothetical protein VGI22_12720 [Xanthobacteraceae bacterium]|jgi:hypothetical protein
MTRAERGGCGRSRRWVACLTVAVGPPAWAGLLATPLAAQTTQQAETAAENAIRRLDLQTAFPRGPEPLNWHFSLPDGALWIVVAIALAALLYALRDMWPGVRAGGAWAEQEAAAGTTAPGTPAVILEAADELAARGRFVEAMHMLLLHGLAHLRARLDQQFSDSLTSREILHSTNLPEDARASLRDVVARVELTYFGQRSAGLTDYTACRESFNALERSLYGSAPA